MWLGWGSFYFFAMSVLYVVGFQNQSAIHAYASFYFIVSVAMTAGVGLDSFNHWCGGMSAVIKTAGISGSFVILVLLMWSGERREFELRSQFHILARAQIESPQLIPELGRVIRNAFFEDTAVICNFLPDYGPQLHYYAQRELLNGVFTPNDWKKVIADPENAPVGGIIWMGEARASDVLSTLPAGPNEEIAIRGIHFVIWRPE